MTHAYTLRSDQVHIHVRVPVTRDLLSELPRNIVHLESPTGIIQYAILATTDFDGLLRCEMCDTPARPYFMLSGMMPHHESWHSLCADHFMQRPLNTLDGSVSCVLTPAPFAVGSPTTDGFIVRSHLRNFALSPTAPAKFCHGCKIIRLDGDPARSWLCSHCHRYCKYHIALWWYIRQLRYGTLPVDVARLIYLDRVLEDRVPSNEREYNCH